MNVQKVIGLMTDAEKAEAWRLLQECGKRRTSRNVMCEVGGIVEINREPFKCVERKVVFSPSEACIGCDLARRWCDNVACSKYDRPDGKNVWYVKL